MRPCALADDAILFVGIVVLAHAVYLRLCAFGELASCLSARRTTPRRAPGSAARIVGATGNHRARDTGGHLPRPRTSVATDSIELLSACRPMYATCTVPSRASTTRPYSTTLCAIQEKQTYFSLHPAPPSIQYTNNPHPAATQASHPQAPPTQPQSTALGEKGC